MNICRNYSFENKNRDAPIYNTDTCKIFLLALATSHFWFKLHAIVKQENRTFSNLQVIVEEYSLNILSAIGTLLNRTQARGSLTVCMTVDIEKSFYAIEDIHQLILPAKVHENLALLGGGRGGGGRRRSCFEFRCRVSADL